MRRVVLSVVAGLAAVVGIVALWACTFELCPDCKANVNLCVEVALPFDGGVTNCPDGGGHANVD